VRLFFGICDLVTAALVLVGVFEGLPSRYMPIDALGSIVAGAFVIGAIASVRSFKHSWTIARYACGLILAVGLLLFALLATSASHLMGIYGPIGRGSALLLLLVAALVVPYLLALPAAQLVWIHNQNK
jgi:hypothetical protein